jgi:hypothetical protein
MSRFDRAARCSSLPEHSPVDGGAIEPEFEALGDALLLGGDIDGACHEIGRSLADAGLTLDEVLGGITRTTHLLGRGEPTFEATRSAALAWTEASLRFAHGVVCDDPLTGLSSLPHLRSQLGALYREAERSGQSVPQTRGLVVVEVIERAPGPGRLGQSLRQLELSHLVREVFSGEEVIAALSMRRLCVLARRDARLGARIGVLGGSLDRWQAADAEPTRAPVITRIWIEPLPATDEAAVVVLDELAR